MRRFELVLCIILCLAATDAGAQKLTVVGDRFLVDGTPRFLTFVTYFGGMGAPNINQDFRLIRSLGFDGIRLWPNLDTGPQLMNGDGSLRSDELKRFLQILDQAKLERLIVDVSFTYEHIRGMTPSTARIGIENVTQAVRSYDNLLFDIQNERNVNDRRFMSGTDVSRIYTAVKAIDPARITFADNAPVSPVLPAGTVAGDLLLITVAIRNSGTGVPNAPAGWTRMPFFDAGDNVQVFGKIHSGSESTPTVTFTGGVAGATCSAKTWAFRGMPVTLDNLADMVVARATRLNTSGQNIACPAVYPDLDGCVVLYVAWKQDDWTSIAAPTDFTEAAESSTTTGDDQALVFGYQIQKTRAVGAPGTLTVTGGGAAISRAAVVALAAGYQTATVSARSVNGAVKEHEAGTPIEVANPFRMGL